MWKYNQPTEELVEQPTMGKPEGDLFSSSQQDLYKKLMQDYNKHIASRRRLTISGPHSWKHEQPLKEGVDFETHYVGCKRGDLCRCSPMFDIDCKEAKFEVTPIPNVEAVEEAADNELIYNAHIRPMMTSIIETCKQNKIPFFCEFMLSKTELIRSSQHLEHPLFKMLFILSECVEGHGVNIDKFCINVENFFGKGNSVYLHLGQKQQQSGEVQAEWEFLTIIRANKAINDNADGSQWKGYSCKKAIAETYEDLISIIANLPAKRSGKEKQVAEYVNNLNQQSGDQDELWNEAFELLRKAHHVDEIELLKSKFHITLKQ